MANERAEKSSIWPTYGPVKSITVPRTLSDCCYSISNIALLIAAIVALVYTSKFLTDDPLYEYGEHLLSLRFYRQLIYVVVIVPLVILVPLFNALSAFMITRQLRSEFGETLARVKIFFQISVAILVAVALFFIAPNMRYNPLASQIELEIRKHMRRYYESEFSYNFLDLLQNEYRCCDTLWFQSNFNHDLPMSCLEPNDGSYNVARQRTCSDVLATLVSGRCLMIAVCFIVIMVALVCLISVDLLECTAITGRHYKVHEQRHSDGAANRSSVTSFSALPASDADASSLDRIGIGRRATKSALRGARLESPSSSASPTPTPTPHQSKYVASGAEQRAPSLSDDGRDSDEINVEDVTDDGDDDDDDDAKGVSVSVTDTSRNRGALDGRKSVAPLLRRKHDDDDDDEDDEDDEHDVDEPMRRPQAHRYRPPADPFNTQCSPAVAARLANNAVLARASLVHTRPARAQSPVFLVDESAQRPRPLAAPQSDQQRHKDLWDVDAVPALGRQSGSGTVSKKTDSVDDSERFRKHQRDLQRDLQTRRSLLSVRFAE